VKRPVILTILAILAIIGGVVSLLLGLAGIFATGLLATGAVTGTHATATSTTEVAIATVALIVLGILYLAFGIGTFMSKSWGWTAGVLAVALYIVNNIISVIFGGSIASGVIGILIALVLIWYLFRPSVRKAYAPAA
jgi:hypothetical protein